jgi:hypothetical protein
MNSIERLLLRLPHDYAGRERLIATAIAEALGRTIFEPRAPIAATSVHVSGVTPALASRAIASRVAAAVADSLATPRRPTGANG